MSEHRPTVTLQIDIFPEDSFLLDDEDSDLPRVEYTPLEVAAEAWERIGGWAAEGYMPVLTVIMPDGTRVDVDLEDAA